MELELDLDPRAAGQLTRLALLAPLKSGRARSRAVRIVWHDSPDRSLAQQGLALAEQRPTWQLEQLRPGSDSWPPGMPAPVLATGRTTAELTDALPDALPDTLVPMAAFEGRATTLDLVTAHGPLALTRLSGAVRAVAGEQHLDRLRLEGGSEAVEQLALLLADEIAVAVPRFALADAAFATAFAVPPPPRREGAPKLPDGLSVADAFTHVVGHLSDVILGQAPGAADGRDGPEPVHQMRVAVRRLRSAIKVFQRAVGCPAVDAADDGLKALAARLGPTRDWDVFVTETLAGVVAAFPAEQRLQRLAAAAERRRRVCQQELRGFLGGSAFRRLGITLACLAASDAWRTPDDAATSDQLTIPLKDYAAAVLGKRLKKLRPKDDDKDDDMATLEPGVLHALRLRAKRLRYAAEVFAPLYPARSTHRFIARLSRLQDRLGALNDGAVAGSLLGELPGSSHAFAIGLVLGFTGAHSGKTRGKIEQAWQKCHRTPPFWA